MDKKRKFVAIPPEETIKELLDDRGITQKEFAARLGMSEKHISHLINGEVKLTQEVALKLEYVLGVSAGFWNNLEAIYQERLLRLSEEKELDSEVEIANK